MKRFITTILTFALILTMAIALPSCDSKAKTVTVGYTDYPPMNYTDENGKLVGFDTELATKMFNELGYEVRFKLIDWGNRYSELNGGTIDCIWNGFTANASDDDGVARSEKVDFSYYYMTNAQCIVRKTAQADISSDAGFEGKTVAFENSSAGQAFVDGITVNTNKKGVGTQMDALLSVKAGTADFAVVDVLLAKAIVGTGDYSTLALNEGIEIAGEYYAVGFKKGSELTDKINELFVKYAENGYLTELAKKYDLDSSIITDYEKNDQE